jgi:hypothetical protein
MPKNYFVFGPIVDVNNHPAFRIQDSGIKVQNCKVVNVAAKVAKLQNTRRNQIIQTVE